MRHVRYRAVDMNAIPDDLRDFDFTWSSCALEHLGSLDAGAAFVLRQMACLRPGGTAVHTTEYVVSSDTDTVEKGGTVLYRRRDIEALAEQLRAAGHEIELDPGEPYPRNAYEATDVPRIPSTLVDAIVEFRGSKVALEAFGDDVHHHLLNTAEQEWEACNRHVSDWELARNFERI